MRVRVAAPLSLPRPKRHAMVVYQESGKGGAATALDHPMQKKPGTGQGILETF
jgi:hypothetical protein